MKMMKKISGIVAAFFLGTIAFAQSSSDSTLKNTAASRFLVIDPQQTSPFNDGIWEGWGTSLCWWANRLGYSQELTDQSAKLFFSDQGLDLNIVRYNIGGGDNPKHNHITRTDSMMEGFLVKKGKNQYEYNWDLDKNQRNVLSKIASISKPFHFEAFANSAPYFMTKSGCTSGAVIGLFDNLKSKSYDDFAEYLATVAEHFKIHEGIEFQSISAMNEPTNIYWWAKSYKQEGCHFGFGKSQSKMTVALKKALDRHNLSQIIITGTDETSVRSQTKAIKKLSKEALSYIKRIDTHTYMGDIHDKQELSKAVQKTGKGLWMSEVDGGSMLDKKFKDEMSCPLWLAKKIIEDYFANFPAISSYIEDTLTAARENGYVETIFGRKRYLPDINSRNATVRALAERNAINAPIQGTSADIIKLAMIKTDKRIRQEGLQSRMILQIHDELVFDTTPDEVERLEAIVREEMENVIELSIPLTVECNHGHNWLEAH